ncbi:MAG: Calx-beta domain-containing protein, partial [Mycolicibacterium sp.]|uniref:Calx-beta domain-containing protein n=1 Tax=Mycolicibacterium sp. TaxID=2320850 RepID=UPI003D141915
MPTSADASGGEETTADEPSAVELPLGSGSGSSEPDSPSGSVDLDSPSGSVDLSVSATAGSGGGVMGGSEVSAPVLPAGEGGAGRDDEGDSAGEDLGAPGIEVSGDGGPVEGVDSSGAAKVMTSAHKTPTAVAWQAAAAETKPVGFLSGLLAALGISPSAGGSEGPLAPATFITAVLDVIRREMNRLFRNQAPTGAPVQVQHSGPDAVSGSIGAVDPEGDLLEYAVRQGPAKGSVIVAGDGTFIYTPGAELAVTGGTDEFVVRVRDVGLRLNVWSPRTVEVPVTVVIDGGVPSALLAAKSVAPLAAAAAVSGGVNSGNGGDELWGEAHYAPYVDMAGWPPPDLIAIARDNGVSLLTLAFIQANSAGQAAWGGYSSLTPGSSDEQAQKIDAAIAAFKAAGGDVMVSFGGENGTELAQAYVAAGRSATELAQAYAGVVDHYGLNRIDFDIEGAAVAEPASIALRSAAIALLQQQRPDLEVWYTLPVLPTGLTHNGIDVVDKALAAGVKFDGINVMAMNFGPSVAPTSGPNAKTMGAYAIDSAESTFAQMSALFAQHGEQFGWNMLGVTPMIGVNYTAGEVFTVADAQALEDFAASVGLGMVSMWSVGRDTPGSLGQATPVASGLDVPAGSFSDVWNDYGTVNTMNLGSTPGGGGGGNPGGGPVTGGTTTVIGWQWGTNAVLDFDPATDKLDFGWFQPANFEVTEAAGSTRIEIVDNNQTYTLAGVGLGEMSMGNIVALDTNTVAKWQALIGGASQPTPALPSISIADLSVSEGNGSHGHFMFVATLSKTSTETVTVTYTTSDGSATAGSDYVATNGTITFAPGVTSQTVHVDIIGDAMVEPNETFTVTLSDPTGATLADATAMGTITNDDVADPGPDPDPDPDPDPQPGDGTIYLVSTSGPDIT